MRVYSVGVLSLFGILLSTNVIHSECTIPPSITSDNPEIVCDSVLHERAEAILNQGGVGLSKEQLVSIFQFIEQNRETFGNKLLQLKYPEEFPCSFEPHSQGIIIRSIHAKGTEIGKGCHKRVKKAIFYGQDTQIIADCISDNTALDEAKILKQLTGLPGVVPFFGKIRRGQKCSIYLKYFPQGSLSQRLHRKKLLSLSEQIRIACDASKGIASMHDKKIVHKDLHSGNILLDTSEKGHSVLVDFGHAMSSNRARNSLPQASKSKNPPEILRCPFWKINKFRSDIYALGCIFFEMVHKGKPVPWSTFYNPYKVNSYKSSKKRRLYRKVMQSYEQLRSRTPGYSKKKQGLTLSTKEAFRLLIFRMIHPNPTHRPSIKDIVSTLETLASNESVSS